MNPYTTDMHHALANDKLDRYRAEAADHRLRKSVRSHDRGNGLKPRWANSLRLRLADLITSLAHLIRPTDSVQTLASQE